MLDINKLKQHALFRKYPEPLEMITLIQDASLQANRPASEVILNDVDLREMMKVSKRTTATWRTKKLIKHAWMEGRVYYILSDVLEVLEANAVKPNKKALRIKL